MYNVCVHLHCYIPLLNATTKAVITQTKNGTRQSRLLKYGMEINRGDQKCLSYEIDK